MQVLNRRILLVAGALLVSTACTQPIEKRQLLEQVTLPSGPSDDRRILAGEWEYEDAAVVTLKLDERGNGAYAWKDGRFETTMLSGRTWHGLWSQQENDREGGFTVEFSPDFSEGEGSWWYTRIGQDRSPSQKGGTFHLTKRSASTALNETPLVP
jgi:hypothetical protein